MGAVTVGVDLGQQHDFSAIVVAELTDADKDLHEVRWMERLPLGTSYPGVVDRVIAVHAGAAARQPLEQRSPELLLDATGLGQPVVDLVRQRKVKVTPVYLTGGDSATKVGDAWRIAKSALVSRLQVLFQDERVRFGSRDPLAEAMVDELLNFEIKVSEGGQDTYGAFKTGAHDDLVVALGLACWRPWKPRGSFVDRYLPGYKEWESQSESGKRLWEQVHRHG